MKILIFHPTLLPPRDYGGVERVVLWLSSALVARGHEVWVAALRGSVLPRGVKLWEMEEDRRSARELLVKLPPGIELVHFMAPPEAGVIEGLACPSMVTVHGNGKEGEAFPLNTVFLSRNHAERHGASVFVYNGVDPAEYRFRPSKEKEDWILFLSKTSWNVKNLRGAIRLCGKAGASLRIAGGQRPWMLRARASLSPRMRWVGSVSGEAKADLLARARAFIFPVAWPEPFGLVVVESLISGTPVFASARGSLPELIPPEAGMTLPLSNESEWIDALRSRRAWDAERCRDWVLGRFDHGTMAASYEKIYQRVARGERLHEKAPVAGDWRRQT